MARLTHVNIDNQRMKDEKTPQDQLFAQPINQVGRFCFDENVAQVFPDMIQRSVPGYNAILGMIGDIAKRYAQDDSLCYDLGCSLGAATLAMRHSIHANNCAIVSVDNSPAMVERCQKIVASDKNENPVTVQCQNIETTSIDNASIVVLNFTLQFIEPTSRHALIQKIYDGLLPGGIVILSEKVKFEQQPHQDLMTDLYHNFKRLNGYSDLEIAQKRTALENVLRPDSIDMHRQRFYECGFNSADIWFQCFNFCSLMAIKS